ncbi:hypothetical protein T10_5423 [Trichinella papuae]|uniref:Uncharacterized protein n=1 Tax=Trichinella papuae TaxID=268474 RepID=A0A0V1M8P0_9BILA|nr:hypothetical protein T10_5423 [Trichinella papuae]
MIKNIADGSCCKKLTLFKPRIKRCSASEIGSSLSNATDKDNHGELIHSGKLSETNSMLLKKCDEL